MEAPAKTPQPTLKIEPVTAPEPPPAPILQYGPSHQAQAVIMVKPPVLRRGTIEDLKRWVAQPSDQNAVAAKALLGKCGPLVVGDNQYMLKGDQIVTVHRELLNLRRMKEAESIEKLRIGGETVEV